MKNQISPTTVEAVDKFTRDRDWEQFHNPKDLAGALICEAAELLEIFQWSGKDLERNVKQDKFKEELADVLIYAIRFAQVKGLNMDEIINAKLAENNRKYPVEKAYGRSDKYNKL